MLKNTTKSFEYSQGIADSYTIAARDSTTGKNILIIEDINGRMDCKMSLVGMVLRPDKIVAFGDTKATIVNDDGSRHHDAARGKVQKVFRTPNFIMAACSTNVYRKGEQLYRIEDWINQHLCEFYDPEDFILGFRNEISSGQNMRSYQFVFGAWDCNGTYIQQMEIQNLRINGTEKSYNPGLYCAGAHEYDAVIDGIRRAIDRNEAEGEDLEICTGDVVANAITWMDQNPNIPYNPAGLPVLTATWTP